MEGSRRLADPSRWVELTDRRPPLALSVVFYGTACWLLVNYLVLRSDGGTAARFEDVVLLVGVLALVPAAALWPLVPWSATASRPRKSVTGLFLLVVLAATFGGSVAVLPFAALAVGNAVVVFGVAGGLGASALIAASAVVVSWLNPALSPWAAVGQGVYALFVCLAVMMIFIALLRARRRAVESRRLLAELEEAHQELGLYAAKVRELSVAEERARMAREMHDSVGHHLTAVNLGLANAQRFRPNRPDAAWDEVRDAQRLTQDALADVRRWVRALKPLRLEGRTGLEAMRELAESFTGADPVVVFRAEGEWPRAGETAELVCYRALQEGLTNALRHSGADTIEVDIACTADTITVRVRDDGGGAATDAAEHGFGLRGLRERVDAVGGDLTFGPAASAGFELRAVVPVRRRRAARRDLEATA